MAVSVKMPVMSKGMTVGEIVEWHISTGDEVQKGDPLLSILTDKAIVEVEAPESGVVLDILAEVGQEIPVGSVVCWIGKKGEKIQEAQPAMGKISAGEEISTERSEILSQKSTEKSNATSKASPVARRMASKHGVQLSSIMGTGPRGLISKSDVEKHIQRKEAEETPAMSTRKPVETHIEPVSDMEEVDRLPLQAIRKVMAERMMQSKQTYADLTTFIDVDMGAIRSIRERIRVTYTSVVVKAAAFALREHRLLNASLEGDEILLHKNIHIGVSVDTPQGLLVVPISYVDRKSLREIDNELRELSQVSKEGHLRAAEMLTPTFTITNSGVLGALTSTPLINPPQSAILGLGRVQETPVVRNDEIVARPMMILALTYDHRIIAGAEAVAFNVAVKSFLEDPVTMI